MKNELIEKVLVDRNDYVNTLRSGYTCDYTLLAESDQVPAYKRPTGFALVQLVCRSDCRLLMDVNSRCGARNLLIPPLNGALHIGKMPCLV